MPGFKPMVKMMTTEPSVELKPQKGRESREEDATRGSSNGLHVCTKILFLCQPVKG
jgi:hypothetical protein